MNPITIFALLPDFILAEFKDEPLSVNRGDVIGDTLNQENTSKSKIGKEVGLGKF